MIRLYCKKIVVNKPELLSVEGPVLFAANHPNSFLDGIILTTLLDAPLYSLARGDAFKKTIAPILRKLLLLPVYRTSEGVQNLNTNYVTFSACQEAFRKKSCVLIFSEARCVNEWKLRPLRKGTARLAFSSWQAGIPLKVIPLAFNYDCFKLFGKTVHLNFGEPIPAIFTGDTDPAGKHFNEFNEKLYEELDPLVYKAANASEVRTYFPENKSLFKSFVCFLPGLAGWLLHAPLFFACKAFALFKFKKSDHYDSILTTLLLLAYPFYLLIIMIFLFHKTGGLSLLALLILPLTAWCWLQIKHLFNKKSS
jgi:1-acyl-sn-glycerol-3-phosphate acyltransferase